MLIPPRWKFLAVLAVSVCFAFGADSDKSLTPPADEITTLVKKAESGHAKAQYNLGVSYLNGTGVPKDDVAGLMWLNLSAAQNNVKASEVRGSISASMTPEQIGEAQRISREWKPTKASASP